MKKEDMFCPACKKKKKFGKLILVDISAVFIRYKCRLCDLVYRIRTNN